MPSAGNGQNKDQLPAAVREENARLTLGKCLADMCFPFFFKIVALSHVNHLIFNQIYIHATFHSIVNILPYCALEKLISCTRDLVQISFSSSYDEFHFFFHEIILLHTHSLMWYIVPKQWQLPKNNDGLIWKQNIVYAFNGELLGLRSGQVLSCAAAWNNLNTFRFTKEVLKIQIVHASYMSYQKSLVQRCSIQRCFWAVEVGESELLMNAFTRRNCPGHLFL